jgi:ATP adenylyltransferase
VPDRLYDLAAARTPEQLAHMEDLEARRACVFCPEHFAAEHREPVLRRGEHWYVTENDFPYAGTEAHYLVVPHEHVTGFEQLPDAAGAELWGHRRWIRERHRARALATVERSGDMTLNGGSVAHLHVHVAVLGPDPAATVRFRVSAKAA